MRLTPTWTMSGFGVRSDMDPTIFGDDVIDNVDDVLASHINNLRAWATAFVPLICNMTEVSTTDTTHTLTDTDTAFQVFTAIGSTDFYVYLPVESTGNHPFCIANSSSDAMAYLLVKTSSSDNMNQIIPGDFSQFIPSGTRWFSEY